MAKIKLSEPNAYVTRGKRLLLVLVSPKNGLSVVVKSLPGSQKTPMKLLAQSVPSILLVTAKPKRRCEDLLAQSALLILE